MIQGYSRSSNC